MDQVDLIHLQDLLALLELANVAEYESAGIRLVFRKPVPAVDAEGELPDQPVVESPDTDAPGGYVKLLGPRLPRFSRSE